MLGFAGGLKSIRSVLLNLVELGPETRQIWLISGYISNHQLATCFTFSTYDVNNKANQKIMKLIKISKGKRHSHPQENGLM